MPISPQQHRVTTQSQIKPISVSTYNGTQPQPSQVNPSVNPPNDYSPSNIIINYTIILAMITVVLSPISACWLAVQPLHPSMGGEGEGWGPSQAGGVGYPTSRLHRFSATTSSVTSFDNSQRRMVISPRSSQWLA